MKVSLQWLNQYIDVSDFFNQPQVLADKITQAGLEVEDLEDPAKNLANVIVGQVKELASHPNADKLTLCQVDIGEGTLRQIVCGAKNHRQGDKVAVAIPGAVLPGDFAIKKSQIRGVDSLGMMCSEVELGLSNESAGIMILPKEAQVGTSFAEYMGLNDIIFELKVTPNRADCLSHLGLARELSALLDRPLKFPETTLKTTDKTSSSLVKLELKNSEWCPRYAGRAIFGVKVGPSPVWLKQSLEKIGLNSINNIVDVTNYVMMELGQPLHAFDATFISESKIIIDNSIKGEKFTTLDGTEIELSGDELTIRDGEKAVALAGIVGGKNSGVNEETKDIFLESAYFTAATVRKTSRRLGIQTDSCYRFSRGTDPDGVVEAMNRACHLIQQVAGGQVAKDFWDEYPLPIKKEPILVEHSYLEERLGYAVDFFDFAKWMSRLSCKVEEDSVASQCWVSAPMYRWDLWSDIDLVEEYGRLHGYDKIPEKLPSLSYEPLSEDKEYTHQKQWNQKLCEEGFLQAVNYNFVSKDFEIQLLGNEADEKTTGLVTIAEAVKISNPISEDYNVMRRRVFTGLFKNLVYNYRHGSEYGRLFETGHVFYSSGEEYKQNMHLGLCAWGQKNQLWQKEKSRPVVYDVKTAIENLLESLHIPSWQWREFPQGKVPTYLHPYQTTVLFLEGRMVGYMGSLHPSLLDDNKIRTGAAMAELDMQKIMRGQPRVPQAKAISKFPAVTRDFSFVMSSEAKVSDRIQKMKKISGSLLQKVEVFDEFTGGQLKEGERSVSFRLTFQDMDGTLNEQRLAQLQKEMLS
ncbi:MAG: phenylalanine--tRNA ligase subunit beta [Bdellovibrionaceae bacterium]|nr:phenylalanine--tRNA ligase subunit beta [Pseudobdellovibrionaceae bacterium]